MPIAPDFKFKPYEKQVAFCRTIQQDWQDWNQKNDQWRRETMLYWTTFWDKVTDLFIGSSRDVLYAPSEKTAEIGRFIRDLVLDMLCVKMFIKPEKELSRERWEQLAKYADYLDSIEFNTGIKY